METLSEQKKYLTDSFAKLKQEVCALELMEDDKSHTISCNITSTTIPNIHKVLNALSKETPYFANLTVAEKSLAIVGVEGRLLNPRTSLSVNLS